MKKFFVLCCALASATLVRSENITLRQDDNPDDPRTEIPTGTYDEGDGSVTIEFPEDLGFAVVEVTDHATGEQQVEMGDTAAGSITVYLSDGCGACTVVIESESGALYSGTFQR